MPHNIPQERRPELHRGGSLKSRSVHYESDHCTLKRVFCGRLYVRLSLELQQPK
jgi:hypothetical protein